MSADTRRDPGDFYPGGKRIVTTPVASGGDVKHSDFADVTVETNTIPKMRHAIETLAQKLGATVAAASIVFVATGAGFDSVPVNEIDFDENPSVVTNVTFDGLLTQHQPLTNYYSKAETDAKIVELAPAPGNYSVVSNKAVNAVQTSELSSLETDPTISAWAKASTKPSYTASEVGAVPTSRTVNGKALSSNISLSYSDVGAASASTVTGISSKVDALETWAIGDETQLRVENAGLTNATLAITFTNELMYSSVVAEANTLAKAAAYTDASALALAQAFDEALATDAWGDRTSSGAPTTPDTLAVEKSKLSLTGGGNFSYIEASVGGYWVMSVSLGTEWTLQSLADAQNPTNAATIVLRDGEGNAIQTVTSTASREAYAVQGEQYISCNSSGANDVITLTYPVVADSAPIIEFAPTVTNEFATVDQWPAYVASVVPSGSSGMWINTVTMVGHPGQGFFKAKYTKAGHAFTQFNQPIGFDSVVIGGITYTVAVETVNGKKLMVLTEVD